MKIKGTTITTTLLDLMVTQSELHSLAEVNAILYGLQELLSDDDMTLTNTSTGEVFNVKEISRVRGIINGLRGIDTRWEVIESKESECFLNS